MRLTIKTIPLLLPILAAALAAAQNDTIQISTRLVQVNVVVRDKSGPVDGLKASDFTVLDNKKTQKIEVFSMLDGREQPHTVI